MESTLGYRKKYCISVTSCVEKERLIEHIRKERKMGWKVTNKWKERRRNAQDEKNFRAGRNM